MTTERRRYFRIADRALIKYRGIAPDDLARERATLQAYELRTANLAAALLDIDVHLQDALAALRGVDRQIAEALDLLNRKLTLLGRVVALEAGVDVAGEYREHSPADVSLSGGGIALTAPDPLDLDAHLAIDLVLLPSSQALRAIGRVVDCRAAGDAAFRIRIEFTDLRENDRDCLVQHIVRRQSVALREVRQGEPDAG